MGLLSSEPTGFARCLDSCLLYGGDRQTRATLHPVMETGAQAMDAVFGDSVNKKDQEERPEAG